MPTETDPHLPAARVVDSPTSRTPAVMSPPVVARYADEYRPAPSPALTDDPGGVVEPYPDGWATDRLSPLAQRLHGDCCDWGGDVAGHGGVDYELEATRVRAQVVGEAVDSGQLIHPDAVKPPVEAKVWAGTWGAFGAGIGLVATVSLLDAINVIPAIFPGSPGVAATVALLTPVAPAVAAYIRGYLAGHTPRRDLEVRR